VILLLVQGGAWLADKVYPILIALFLLALVVTVSVAFGHISENAWIRGTSHLRHVLCLWANSMGLERPYHLTPFGAHSVC
jgi:hypothetical protein